MHENPLLAFDRAEIALVRDEHLRQVYCLPDGHERDAHLKRAEHLNDVLAEMPE